jgi:hypothetical protein
MYSAMITESDYQRLVRLLHSAIQREPKQQFGLLNFYQEIRQAEIVKSDEVPNDIVTMRSIVTLVDHDSSFRQQVQ